MPPFMNVLEAATVYDTLCVCQSMYGAENQADGWFNTMADFGNWQDHLFFKNRSEANVGLAYSNMQSADRIDYAFHAFSVGARFFAPPSLVEWPASDAEDSWTLNTLKMFWEQELPNHVSFTLRIGQDDQIDLAGMLMPPGYGPQGAGASLGLDDAGLVTGGTTQDIFSQAQSIFVGTQGVPDISNRYSLVTEIEDPETGELIRRPLEIPRNETIEIRMKLSEYAQTRLRSIAGPGYLHFPTWAWAEEFWVKSYTAFAARYGIQVSLYGVREVQQRGEYHVG